MIEDHHQQQGYQNYDKSHLNSISQDIRDILVGQPQYQIEPQENQNTNNNVGPSRISSKNTQSQYFESQIFSASHHRTQQDDSRPKKRQKSLQQYKFQDVQEIKCKTQGPTHDYIQFQANEIAQYVQQEQSGTNTDMLNSQLSEDVEGVFVFRYENRKIQKTQDIQSNQVGDTLTFLNQARMRGTQQETKFYSKSKNQNYESKTDQGIRLSMEQDQSFNVNLEYDDKKLKTPIMDIERIRASLMEHLNSFDSQDHDIMENFFQEHYITISGLDMKCINLKQFVRLNKYKNFLYYGESFNNLRHGNGILIQLTNPLTIYEGQWQNNLRFGKGFQLFKNGNIYSGFFLNGKPDGFGCFYWISGDVYTGQWGAGGVKHGSGSWTGYKGDEYLGEWKNGLADGQGVHKWLNGDRYEGEFRQSLKHGKGMEKYANGDHYVGEYQNGKPSGLGDYKWVNGCNYRGQFYNGLRQGKGIWQMVTADTKESYDGQWVNDQRVGYGIYKYGNNHTYCGGFSDNQRHGYGVMSSPNGQILDGLWEWGQFVQSRNIASDQTQNRHYSNSSQDPKSVNKYINQRNYRHVGPQSPQLQQNFSIVNEEQELDMQVNSFGQNSRQTTPNQARFIINHQRAQTKFAKKQVISYSDKKNYQSQSQQRRNNYISENNLNSTVQYSSRSKNISTQDQNLKSPKQLSIKELRSWNVKAKQLFIDPGQYGKLDNKKTTKRIREILNPPIWKPPGIEFHAQYDQF